MSLVTRRILFERFYPIIQTKRFRGKINIERPKPLFFERAVYVELTKPWFINPKATKQPIDLCQKLTEKSIEEVQNPYQQIIACELRERFDHSRLVAFYHLNPMKAEHYFKAFVMFKKANMHLKRFGKKTLELAVKDSHYETILNFYVSQNITVFSPEPDLKKLLKITKKFPELVLFAAIYEGKLISKDEITQLDLIPNLQSAQANLVHTLNSAATTLTQQLNSHQNTLVSHLQERIKQFDGKE